MAHSVELRLPFLEHDLLEFALSLNTKSYFLNGKSKSVLRYAAKDYIDPRVRFKKIISSVASKQLVERWKNKRIHK